MKERARRELAKRGIPKKKEEEAPSNREPPSMFSGISLILAGSLVLSVFIFIGEWFLGFLASSAFMIIGMYRLFKANMARYQPRDEVSEA